MPSRIAFSTLAFPDATLAAAVSAGRRWGYSGVALRLIDGELIDPAMPAARRAQVRRTLATAGLPVVAVDSSIRLTGDDPGPDLHRFLQLASDWEAPLVRVFGGDLDPPPARQDRLRTLSSAASGRSARPTACSGRTWSTCRSRMPSPPPARSCRPARATGRCGNPRCAAGFGLRGLHVAGTHLAQAGRYGGFSGPEGFTLAARSLKLILNELGIPWR